MTEEDLSCQPTRSVEASSLLPESPAFLLKQEIITYSPLSGFKKPQPKRRETFLKPDEFEKILPLVRAPFRELATIVWETGCRPQEAVAVEKRHVDLEFGRWVFPADESKGKSSRVVYLNEKSLEITKRLCEAHPEGPLFRNEDGQPWTCYAINCTFVRLKPKLGRKLCLYALRHSWATL